MNTNSTKHPHAKAKRSWMLSGIFMMLVGLVLFASVTLSAIGIMLLILGLGILIAAHIRQEKT